ncbi:hypothetical protein MNV49_002765 [Pseudohyphozyma bogoriensis]|nr:hypothetical protein MNV49_002765 [Pseudohyphozyma bogoriensis]
MIVRHLQPARWSRTTAAAALVRRPLATASAARPVLTAHPDSSLRTAFDTPSSSSTLSLSSTGLFGQLVLQSPASFTPLAHRTILRAQFIVTRICAPQPTPASVADAEVAFLAMVKNLDRLSDLLCGVIDLCELVRHVHEDEAWREGANEAYAVLCEYMNELNTHVGLYEALKSLHSLLPPSTPTKSPQLYSAYAVAIPFLRDFEKSGIHLPASSRSQFVDLSSSIIALGRTFLQNTAMDSRPPVEVEIDDVGDVFGEGFLRRVFRAGQKKAALDPASWEGRVLARQHPDGELRRKLYVGANSASKDYVETLEELLRTRGRLANLVGRDTWAEVALEDKMARSPTNVSTFLSALNKHNKPKAEASLRQLSAIKRQHVGGSGRIEAWDRDFYADVAGENTSPLPDISAFFSVGTCFQGLSRLFTALYGIRFEVEDVKPGEVWHPAVKKLKVVDEDEGVIGTIYCDLFMRAGKGPGAAHYTVRCSRRMDDDDAEGDFKATGGKAIVEGVEVDRRDLEGLEVEGVRYGGREGVHQSPIIALVCGFGSGGAETSESVKLPAFLQWHEVETLFHEMGHAIHSMIGRTDYHNVAGTRCATDFVELPSILMEHFVSSPSVVSLFSSHHSTNRPLPVDILHSVLAERRRFSALETSTQISMAALDQAYHSTLPLERGFSSTDVARATQTNYHVVPFPEGTAWQVQFGHLFGYGATYYSYLFDRAIAAQIFAKKFADEPLSRERGEEFKRMCLRWGGGRDAWEMVGEVLGDEVVMRGGEGAMEKVGRWGIEEAAEPGMAGR